MCGAKVEPEEYLQEAYEKLLDSMKEREKAKAGS